MNYYVSSVYIDRSEGRLQKKSELQIENNNWRFLQVFLSGLLSRETVKNGWC